jgi:lactoylglutathione lyase
MRTLHVGLRVSDLERSLAFYAAVGYQVVGIVPETPLGRLTMLKLPDDDFVAVELVHDPTRGDVERGSALSHLVVKVESMDAVLATLADHGIDADPPGSSDDSNAPRTRWLTDPDGNRIELVQWPPGHPDGLTAADWPD